MQRWRLTSGLLVSGLALVFSATAAVLGLPLDTNRSITSTSSVFAAASESGGTTSEGGWTGADRLTALPPRGFAQIGASQVRQPSPPLVWALLVSLLTLSIAPTCSSRRRTTGRLVHQRAVAAPRTRAPPATA